MTSYASAWNTWFPLIERGAAPLTRRMIALAAIEGDDKVLDVGTGIGEPAITAARAVGPRGSVLAIDSDRTMIDLARERAELGDVRNVTFLVGRVEELTCRAGSFDAILCRWSLMFVDDLVATLTGLRRLLRPGGRIVAATWGPPDRVPGLSLARSVIHRHLGREPPAWGPKTAYALADTDALTASFHGAGFSEVVQERAPVTLEFLSVDDYVRFRFECTGSLFSGVGDVTDEARAGALGAVAAALEAFRVADGSFKLANEAWCTAAALSTRGA